MIVDIYVKNALHSQIENPLSMKILCYCSDELVDKLETSLTAILPSYLTIELRDDLDRNVVYVVKNIDIEDIFHKINKNIFSFCEFPYGISLVPLSNNKCNIHFFWSNSDIIYNNFFAKNISPLLKTGLR